MKEAPEGALLEGYDAPRRAGAQRSATVVGSYAAMLRKTVLPTNGYKPNQYNAPKQRPRKRSNTNLILTHDNNSQVQNTTTRTYASLLQQTQPTDSAGSWETQPPLFSTNTVTNTPTSTIDRATIVEEVEKSITTDLENKLDEKLQEKFQEMKKTFTHQMNLKLHSLSKTIENNITTLIQKSLEDLTTTMQATLSAQMTHMMKDLTEKITSVTAGSYKRTQAQMISPPPKMRKGDSGPKIGQGNQQNATSIPQSKDSEDAMHQ